MEKSYNVENDGVLALRFPFPEGSLRDLGENNTQLSMRCSQLRLNKKEIGLSVAAALLSRY
jgi:hypothetical protein